MTLSELVSDDSIVENESFLSTNLSNDTGKYGNDTKLALIFSSQFLAIMGMPVSLENMAAIFILSRCRKMSFQIKALSLNLAVTDCLAGLLLAVPNDALMISGCRYKKIIVGSLLFTSTFTVTAFNVDRCCSFHFNMLYQQYVTEKRIRIACLLFWVFGVFFAYLLFFDQHDGHLALNCGLLQEAPMGVINRLSQIIPLVIVFSNIFLFAYLAIYLRRMTSVKPMPVIRVADGSQAIRVKGYMNEQARAVIKLSVITGSFLCMCVPYMILQTITEEQVGEEIHRQLRFFTGILLFANSAWNPVLYVWRFQEARFHLKQLACFCCKGKRLQYMRERKSYFATYSISSRIKTHSIST